MIKSRVTSISAMLLTISIVLSLTGCGANTTITTTGDETAASSQQKTENVFDNKNEEFGSSFMKSRSSSDDFDDTEIQYPGSEG